MKEKIKRISSSTWALLLALMMVVSSFSVLAATTNVNKTGETKTKVYFVPASQSDFSGYLNSSKTDIDSKYTVKLNLHYGSNDSDKWEYVDVTKSSDTFGGKSVYFSEFTDMYNGLAEMQIQIYDGETQKKLVKPITTWTEPSVYNGKVYDDGSWKTYTPDTTKVADSVSLLSNATDGKIAKGTDLKLTATATGKVSGDVTYTFYNGSTQVGDAQTRSESTATTTVSGLSAGDYTFTVKVTKNGYTEVASDPINVTVTASSVSDDIISVLNGDKIMFYITVNSSWNPTSPLYVKEDASPYSIVAKLDNSNGAVTVPQAKYRLSNSSTWEGNQMSDVAVAGYKYRLDGTIGSTTSSGSATTTVNSDNTITTDFIAGQSGDGKKYTLVYYMKDSSGNYSKVGISADEVNTKVASLLDGTYTLYTCSTDGTITVLRDTDTIDITTSVAKSVNLTASPENVVVGGSSTLTATLETPNANLNADNVTYTFTEGDKELQKGSSDTFNLENLTEGTHTYKVTVSADGYTSVTATVEVNVNQPYNVTAKYKTTEDGVTYSAEKADTNIVTVDGAESSTTSSGTVVAKDTITIDSSTYVFAGWKSENGSFTDATNASTKFRPSADAVAIAQYKKQYTVSASTTGGNGTINVEKDTYLAGDKVTININPNPGYQLKSLMRSTGIPSVPIDVTNYVNNNKYVVDKISSDETFEAEFEKNPLDYSKYRVVGHFDDNKSWSFNDGCKFDTNGKATFTIAQPTAVDGNGQFRIAWSDGSTTIQYGCGLQNDLKEVKNGEIYTPVKDSGKPYYVSYKGTYVVEIVNIDANGVPKFKVTKDDTISNYQLYISKGRNQEGKLLGNFTKAKDGTTYQYIITVDAGTHYFYIKDSTSTNSSEQYSDGMENCELGKPYLMNRRYDIMNIQYKLSAGSYKVTYSNIDTNGQGKFKIDSLSKPLAESVDLSSSATAVKTGNNVTLTAKINKKYVEDSNAYYTYTFYDGKGNQVEKIVTKETTASCKTTSNTKGVVSYKVVVSTNATYTDDDYPNVNLTYTDISSKTIDVDYRDKILYIAEVKNGTLGKLYQLTADSFKPADGAQSVTIAVFSDETISDDTVCNLTVSESKNKYTTITSSTIDTDDVAGIPTYTINCNAGASSPTIYIVDDNIYAVATFDMGATNTFDNTNTVDYYFAEPTDDTGISTTGDGLRIKYWNNSVATQYDYADVTTKVDKDGKASGSNTITVNMKDLYSSGVEGSKTFNVYKVSLPVWATSFRFVSSGTTEIPTFSTFVPNAAGDASIGLNPNRIYLLYKNGDSYYSRGVVLDSSFWTKTSSENNNVPTKNFKANAVNYNTQYDLGGNVTNTFNTNLNALYDTAYANPLFFGYFKDTTTQVAGNQNFRIQDNLAMRHDNNHAYYASVQGLAGNTLSSTSKNENGCGYLLTADGSGNMPLFDYDKLKDNTNVASNVYEGLNFPFNESTFNGITTYSYDSFTDKNRVIDGDFKVDTYSNATVGNDKGVGFFPFDNSDSTNNANKYGFGTEFDIDFYMSETGKLTDADGKGKDITFNFSGDDDVWVYVDGVLVLDLGGAHKVSSGSINFSTMKVIYKAAVDTSDNISARGKGTADTYATDKDYVKTVDLAKIFKANGAEFNNKNSSKKHTLQMFYMERGSFDSNCSVSFNLPQNTGLLVRNDVNFDSVNPGLKEATMGIANKDYFSYMIENKYASDAEFDKLKGKYVTLPNKTTSDIINNNGNFTFDTSNPLYPIVTADNIIRRVVNGTTYYLAVKNGSGNSCNSYWPTLLEDAYKGLPSINFSLPDDFAKLENSTNVDNSTAVSGQTDTKGVFNLLFNQSAKFNSKIPSNTMVKVVQNETLYEVNAGDKSTAMSVATDADGKKATRRNVSNFYSTSYKITDDKSQKVITEAKGNKGSNVFSNDTSAKTDGFYFADYSENHSNSSAMTVNFTNTVSTSDIKIIKNVTTDSSDNRVDPKSGDRFTFTVKLSNIFGDKDDKTLKEYENLTYKVYDSKGNLEGTRTYGKSGVSITANEYAVITGIPVGTHYEVTEKQRTGYQFASVNGEFVATTLNSTKAAAQTNEIKDTDFISCKDSVDSTIITDDTDAKTVTGNMPIANDANNNAGKTVQLTYTNKEAGFTISFKYYDREVKTGTVAHINTKPTVVNYVFSVSELATYKKSDDTYDYAGMITKAVTAGGINPGNVIDSYKCFTSQNDAETGIQNEFSYRKYDKTNSKYLTYGEAYTNGNFKNHTDCYGRLQGSDGAVVNDGEDWVSYYNGKTKYATEKEAKKANTPVTSITVWFFNNLKSYSPTFKYATNSGELKAVDNGKFVGTVLNTIKPVFYNVRLGVANGVDSIDEEGSYLKEYGVTGFTGTYSGTAMSIQNGKKELKFLYWSYDENGKSIASNSYKYGYRVTNNIKLYAIYGEAKDKTDPGLTVSMNNPDYHIDSNGINRVRLNTVMNVYNCPDDDPNIKNVAVIYILDPNNFIQDYIDKDNKTALKNIRKNVYDLIKANGSKAQFSGVTIKIDGTNDNKALGLTYTASKELLTNKNRVQFTTDFKQSALADQKIIYTFSAMNYYNESATEESKTDWIVSDNCIKYIFDANGKVDDKSTQVNCLQ